MKFKLLLRQLCSLYFPTQVFIFSGEANRFVVCACCRYSCSCCAATLQRSVNLARHLELTKKTCTVAKSKLALEFSLFSTFYDNLQFDFLKEAVVFSRLLTCQLYSSMSILNCAAISSQQVREMGSL